MAEVTIQLNVGLVERLTPVLASLLKRIGAAQRLASDPVVIAAEAAAQVAIDPAPQGVEEVVFAAIRVLPPCATQFERGLAAGMALVLVAERSPG